MAPPGFGISKNFFSDITKGYVDQLDGTSYNRRGLVPIPRIDVSFNGVNDFAGYITNTVGEKFLQIIRMELPIALDVAFNTTWPETSSDLIDTGNLRDSLRIDLVNGALKVRYDAPYAGIVHYGGYIVPYGNTNAQRVYVPPRPFLDYVINGGGPFPAYDFQDALYRAINSV